MRNRCGQGRLHSRPRNQIFGAKPGLQFRECGADLPQTLCKQTVHALKPQYQAGINQILACATEMQILRGLP